jgi:AcrR family transcriptional regulator
MLKTRITRKQKEKLTHKWEIFEAALNLFSSKGFHNVSMQEIADKSDFAVGTLYNFFDSKESLFEDLINHFGEKILGEVAEILDGPGNEAERLIAFIRYQPQIQEKYSEVIKLYASVLGTQIIALSKIQNKSRIKETMDLKIMRLIEQGIHKGFFRAVDPEIATKAINSTIEKLAFEIAGRFDKAKATETFKKVEQLFINVLLTPETRKND